MPLIGPDKSGNYSSPLFSLVFHSSTRERTGLSPTRLLLLYKGEDKPLPYEAGTSPATPRRGGYKTLPYEVKEATNACHG